MTTIPRSSFLVLSFLLAFCSCQSTEKTKSKTSANKAASVVEAAEEPTNNEELYCEDVITEGCHLDTESGYIPVSQNPSGVFIRQYSTGPIVINFPWLIFDESFGFQTAAFDEKKRYFAIELIGTSEPDLHRKDVKDIFIQYKFDAKGMDLFSVCGKPYDRIEPISGYEVTVGTDRVFSDSVEPLLTCALSGGDVGLVDADSISAHFTFSVSFDLWVYRNNAFTLQKINYNSKRRQTLDDMLLK
ncbi:MAG: hypothetical protein HRU19_27590 [Pseudobacteriovorax sp.]|nr:hypothetical protein [Pseudobacteriovorax sp.]